MKKKQVIIFAILLVAILVIAGVLKISKVGYLGGTQSKLGNRLTTRCPLLGSL